METSFPQVDFLWKMQISWPCIHVTGFLIQISISDACGIFKNYLCLIYQFAFKLSHQAPNMVEIQHGVHIVHTEGGSGVKWRPNIFALELP